MKKLLLLISTATLLDNQIFAEEYGYRGRTDGARVQSEQARNRSFQQGDELDAKYSALKRQTQLTHIEREHARQEQEVRAQKEAALEEEIWQEAVKRARILVGKKEIQPLHHETYAKAEERMLLAEAEAQKELIIREYKVEEIWQEAVKRARIIVGKKEIQPLHHETYAKAEERMLLAEAEAQKELIIREYEAEEALKLNGAPKATAAEEHAEKAKQKAEEAIKVAGNIADKVGKIASEENIAKAGESVKKAKAVWGQLSSWFD
ncbi:MAG: hypothetical protein V4482_01945 [Pseudomonadota bacterium]